ncbi:hypothetical protein HKBW3S03_02014, partial [Candidatus Hakubella thermalkaliphila]
CIDHVKSASYAVTKTTGNHGDGFRGFYFH